VFVIKSEFTVGDVIIGSGSIGQTQLLVSRLITADQASFTFTGISAGLAYSGASSTSSHYYYYYMLGA
jgi:hypothetical protein